MDPKRKSKAKEQAEFCGILGNTLRIRIVWALGDQELTVSEIAKRIDTSMQNTSQHLRLMKDKGVLQFRRDGREIYYRIAETEFSRVCPVISKNRSQTS